MKQVPGLAVLNFDFVIPFAVPFRFQNVTRRVTGFDRFQYSPRQLANRNVFIGSNCYLGPVPMTSLLVGHSLPTIEISVPDNRGNRTPRSHDVHH